MDENNNPVIENNTKIFENNDVLKKSFLWMFLGLLATGLISWYTYKTDALINFAMSGGLQILLIIEIVVVIIFSLISKKMPPIVVGALFFIYAAINGITMSSIFYVYQMESIISVFFVTAVVFGVMALLGYTTKIDLSKFSTLLFGLLIAGIVASLINLFLGNPMIDLIISWAMLIVFFGVTAYDIQKIKRMAGYDGIYKDKLHIYAAMDFYLDFINIFLRILSIFGKRRN